MGPTKLQIIEELESLGYLAVRLYSTRDGVSRWAALKPYGGGFAIAAGDLDYIHNELWWFKNYKRAKESLDRWEDLKGSPPSIERESPRLIRFKGQLKRWKE